MSSRSSSAQSELQRLLDMMDSLSTNTEALARQSQAVATEQLVLKSLGDPQMYTRITTIPPPTSETFEWDFEPRPGLQFLDWLETESGIFWIQGKAGSGNSTLMKHIWNHRHTRETFERWAQPERLLTAKCFFSWYGPAFQKSLLGLFRSLLFEILQASPDLIASVRPGIAHFHSHSNDHKH